MKPKPELMRPENFDLFRHGRVRDNQSQFGFVMLGSTTGNFDKTLHSGLVHDQENSSWRRLHAPC